MSAHETDETFTLPTARTLWVAWTPDAEPCVTTPRESLWESWSAALDELISDPQDEAAYQRLLFYSRAHGTWGAYNLNLVRERFASLEEPDWYRDAVDIQVVWSVNQAVAFAPHDPAARRALEAFRFQLPQHPQLAHEVATNFPSTLAGQQARALGGPYLITRPEQTDTAGISDPPGPGCLSPCLPHPSPGVDSPQHLTNLVGADFPDPPPHRPSPPTRATTTHRPPFQMPCFRGTARDEGLGR